MSASAFDTHSKVEKTALALKPEANMRFNLQLS